MALNVCVIGAGDMGCNHARAWAAHEQANVVGISDPDHKRAQAICDELGAKPFADYKQAICSDSIDIVSICTPTALHDSIASFAAEHGRHILTEKPLALTLEQGRNMIEIARANNVKFAVSLQYRDMWYGKVAKLIKEGVFGGPIVLNFLSAAEVRPKIAMHSKSLNGGPIIDMACHYFDLMRFLTGCEPLRVYARGGIYGKGKQRLNKIKDLALDMAVINVEYENGHILDFTVNWGMPEGFPSHNAQSVMGPQLMAHQKDDKLILQFGDHKELWDAPQPEFPPSRRIDDLIEAIQKNRDPEISGEDALVALRLSLAAIESIETGKVVEIN